MFKFLSTPSGWRATGGHGLRYADRAGISIHALRVEGDEPPEPPEPTPGNFYPRPPGGGRQTGNVTGIHTHWISIHALRVEGDEDYAGNFGQAMISIHALRVEGDHDPGRFPRHDRGISIHALRVEGDNEEVSDVDIDGYFYPRPPGGGRRRRPAQFPPRLLFLSTPSGWRATGRCASVRQRVVISIHALRVEGDVVTFQEIIQNVHFYPRPPGGGRLLSIQYSGLSRSISIHALRVEGDGLNGTI